MNKHIKMKTPKSNRKGRNRNLTLDNNRETLSKQSTPISKTNDGCMSDVSDDSPIFRCTQDGGIDDCEVVWDWNSPQRNTKQHRRKCSRRSLTRKEVEKSQSPLSSISMRRKIIRRDVNGFNSLKKNLEALNEKLLRQRNQSNDTQSSDKEEPRNENENLCELIKTEDNVTKSQESQNSLETLFDEDDSFTDCLVQCSQEIEDKYYKKENSKLNNNDDKLSFKLSDTVQLKTDKNCASTSYIKKFDYNDIKFDDSFDTILGSIDDNDIERMALTSNTNSKKEELYNDKCKEKFNFKHTSNFISKQTISTLMEKKITSNVNISQKNSTPMKIEKKYVAQENRYVELKSSKSCPSEFQCTSEEIERKRLEAIAKLDRKMKVRPKSSTSIHSESPNKYLHRKNNSFDIGTPIKLISTPVPTKLNESNQVYNKISSELNVKDVENEIERKRKEAIVRLQRTRHAIQVKEISTQSFINNTIVER